MRLYLLFFVLVTSSRLVNGQIIDLKGEWERFYHAGEITDVATSDDAAWFVMENYLVKVDFATHATEVGISVINYHSYFPVGIRDIWIAPDDQVYVLSTSDRLHYLTQGIWEVAVIPPISGRYDARKLVHRDVNGAYLFKGAYFDLFWWTPGEQPRPAYEFTDLVSFPIDHAIWEADQARLWVTGQGKVGYFEDDEFIYVPLPDDNWPVIEMQLDKQNDLWLRTALKIFRFDGQKWLDFRIPTEIVNYDIHFTPLNQGQALLASNNFKLLLTLEDDNLIGIDYSEELADLAVDHPFAADGEGKVWMIDQPNSRVGSWRPGEVEWQRVNQWLPLSGNQVYAMTVDADRRIWIGGYNGLYFFSQNSWQPAQAIYPDIPEGSRDICFSPKNLPVVIVRNDEQQGFFSYQVPGGWQQLTDTLYPDISYGEIKIDQHGYLQMLRFAVGGYSVWDRGGFTTVIPSDIFPAPAFFTNFYLEEDGTQFIISDLGVYRRYGNNYILYPFNSELLLTSFTPTLRTAQFSPSGTVWLANGKEVFRWNVSAGIGQMTKIHTFDSLHTITSIHPLADDDVWVKLANSNLYNYDGEKWYRYRDLSNYNDPNVDVRLPNVKHIVRDDQNRTWLHGGGDLWVFTPEEQPEPPIHKTPLLTQFTIAPNPARNVMLLSWKNLTPGFRQLNLYDISGKLIRTLLAENQEAGVQQYGLLRDQLSSGIYFLVLEGPGQREVRKIVWK